MAPYNFERGTEEKFPDFSVRKLQILGNEKNNGNDENNKSNPNQPSGSGAGDFSGSNGSSGNGGRDNGEENEDPAGPIMPLGMQTIQTKTVGPEHRVKLVHPIVPSLSRHIHLQQKSRYNQQQSDENLLGSDSSGDDLPGEPEAEMLLRSSSDDDEPPAKKIKRRASE